MLEQVAGQTSLCAACPKMCRHVCPVANTEKRETVTPGLKMNTVDLLRRGLIPLDAQVAQTLQACTGCGACSRFCMLGNNVAQVLFEARAVAAAAGVSSVAARVERAMEASGNPTGAHLSRLAQERLPSRPEHAALMLWPGCTALRRLPEHAANALTAVERATGSTVGWILPQEDAACCGYPLWAAGLRDAFGANARKVAAHLKDRGALFTSDPGCAWTFNVLYPWVGAPLEAPVLHVSQVLAQGSLSMVRTARPQRALYHDPCYLSRHLKIHEEPRQVLGKIHGVAPAEFTWSKEDTECCGGGGLYPHSQPELALQAARRRVHHEVDELERTQTHGVITACPSCELQFGRAGVPVMDLGRAVLGGGFDAPRTEGRKPPQP